MRVNLIPSLLVIVILLSVASCGGGVYGKKPELNQISITPINSLFIEERKVEDKSYESGKIQTAYVGESLIKKKSYMAKVQSKLMSVPALNTVLTSTTDNIILNEGKPYQAKYDVFIDGQKFTVMEVETQNGLLGVLFDANGVISDRVMKDGILIPESFRVSPLNAYVKLERPEEVLEQKTIENFEIVFGGVNNSQINMTYREYSPDDVARTAFFQELTYPTNSEFIRYKTLKIKVHKVTSEGITFEVVSD